MLKKKKANKSYKISLPHIEIAVKEWGYAQGHPVIALHGWMDNMASFYPLLSETKWLEQNNLRLICIDLPGHGHSGHRHPSHPCHLLEYVQDLHDLVDYFQFESLSLMGHSLGAGIATLYAGSLPDKIKSLVLLEGILPNSEEKGGGPTQLAKALLQRNRYSDKDNQSHPHLQPLIDARVKVGDLDEENVTLLIKRNTIKTSDGYYWRSDPRLRLPSALYLTPAQSGSFLSQLHMPVLLLYGKDGFINKYPMLNEIISRLPDNFTISEVEGGHHLHMQHPVAIRKAITDFFQ